MDHVPQLIYIHTCGAQVCIWMSTDMADFISIHKLPVSNTIHAPDMECSQIHFQSLDLLPPTHYPHASHQEVLELLPIHPITPFFTYN